MAIPKQMIRLSDGEVMPYSATLVASHPGEFAPARWNRETQKFERIGTAPCVPPPPPPDTAEVVAGDDWDDEPDATPEDWQDPEPETAGAEEAAQPKAAPVAKKRAKRAAPRAG